MSPFETILVLVIVGFLMLAAEVFVPGAILGLLGGLCLVAAIGFSYAHYGVATGTVALMLIGSASLAGFIAWMFLFPKTPIGRRIMLNRTLEPGRSKAVRAVLLGRDGVAFTPLRPSGVAIVDGRKVDVVAESDFIDADAPVTVVADEGMRIVVRKRL